MAVRPHLELMEMPAEAERKAEMERDENRMQSDVIRLFSGGSSLDIRRDRIKLILTEPELIAVPGAPEEIAGMIYYEEEMQPVFYLDRQYWPKRACIVLICEPDGSMYGVLGEKVAGGEESDTFYGSGI